MNTQLSDSASCGIVMWTAPVFFDISGGGLGLTLGYATVDSLILVEDEGALDAYYKTQVFYSAAISSKAAAYLQATFIRLSVKSKQVTNDTHHEGARRSEAPARITSVHPKECPLHCNEVRI
jgi:hypothetical protein